MKRLLWVVVLLVVLAVAAVPALAQVPTPTMNEINAIARDLWCPLCNGVRLDNCDLQACIQMREVIAEKIVAGESKEQIKAYFVQQYGDVVLGQPSREGFNLIVWVFPILAALVGVGWVIYLVTVWRKKRPAPAPAASQQPTTPRRPGEEGDDYAQRIERELKQLD